MKIIRNLSTPNAKTPLNLTSAATYSTQWNKNKHKCTYKCFTNFNRQAFIFMNMIETLLKPFCMRIMHRLLFVPAAYLNVTCVMAAGR